MLHHDLFSTQLFVGKPAHAGPRVAPSEVLEEVEITKVNGAEQQYALTIVDAPGCVYLERALRE